MVNLERALSPRPIMIHARFSISTMMLVVLVLALNLFAGGPFYGPTGMEGTSLLNPADLPMASILAVGMFVLVQRPKGPPSSRRFLVGFEAFGLAALLLYIACIGLFPKPIHQQLGDLLKRLIWPGRPLFAFALMAFCVLPQFLVALLGGFLNTRYRVVRRQAENTGTS
jgi:hypothetical protein